MSLLLADKFSFSIYFINKQSWRKDCLGATFYICVPAPGNQAEESYY